MGDKLVPSTCLNTRRKTARVLYPTDQEESSPVCFFKAIFVITILKYHFLKSLNQLIVLFRVFKFSAASFNSVISSRVTVLNLDAILAPIENTRAVAMAIL